MSEKYTHDQLEKAFDLVKNREHWKNPIDAYCRGENLAVISEAISYFTATLPSISQQENGWYRVVAQGYRQGPAGDH